MVDLIYMSIGKPKMPKIKPVASSGRDPYSAVWVSHSSMGDFLKCPRCYYLHNVYKDPKTRRKINVVSPALALGVAVHEVVEGLDKFKTEDRFKNPEKFFGAYDTAWAKVSGKRGGFKNQEEEAEAKARGRAMIERVISHPGPLALKTVKLKGGLDGSGGDMLPHYFISPEENIILCGKIDWLIYNDADDSLSILDFKTGKHEEKEESLQLPIYQLLLHNLQKREVTGAKYWYLDKDTNPIDVSLPGLDDSFTRVIEVARKVKAAREKGEFLCPKGKDGCFACKPFEKIIQGEAEYVGVGEYNQDIYLL
jgi:ATP-dependent helicase/DNAse subunit B